MKMTTTNRILLCAASYFAMFVTGKYLVWPQKPDTVPPEQPYTIQTTAPPVQETTAPPVQTTAVLPQSTAATSAESTPAQSTPAGSTVSAESRTDESTAPQATSSAPAESTTATSTTAATTTELTTTTETTQAADTPQVAPENYFADALFIGDSRTVGQAYYGPIEGASYFASTGMSTANIYSSKSETDPTKGLTFDNVITARQYGKVYVMLGINELGNDRTATLNNFSALLDRIKAAQPNAIIYIEANLHVTAARSAQNVYGVNNASIDSYNAALAAFADSKTVFYIDINPVFDDGSGALRADTTGDGVHPQAEHYLTWKDWLMKNVIVR